MPQTRALPVRRLGSATCPVLAVDGDAARRSLNAAGPPPERFEVLDLPDRLVVGQLAPLMRSRRGRDVVVWPAPGAAGAERALHRAEMLAAADIASIGITTYTDDHADAQTLIDRALREALARAMPQQGCRAPRAVLPWGSPVDLRSVLAETSALFARYLDLTPSVIETLSLWCLHTWCVRSAASPFELSPRLVLQGASADAAHARALRVLAWATPAPLIVSRTIAAHVLPVLAAEQPTLLFDDIAGGMLYRRDMRTLIAAGAMRDGVFLSARTRRNPTGRAACFAPAAIATTASLPDDMNLRAIVLTLPRPARDSPDLPMPGDPPEGVLQLRAKLQTAAAVAADRLAHVHPAAPPAFHAAAREKWRPLIALAYVVELSMRGGVTLAVQSASLSEAASASALLQDLHTLYGDADEHVPSARMLADLAATARADRTLDAAELARRLAAFGLRPVSVRLKDQVVRGYRAEELAEAFARYLIPFDAVTSNASVAAV